MKEERVCRVCNKTVLTTDREAIHFNLHLECALDEEFMGKGIKEQYLEASEEIFIKTKSKFNWWPTLPKLRGNK